MRIVNRKDFLKLSAGTLFMKFPKQPKDQGHFDVSYSGEIMIKAETSGDDFYLQRLVPWFEGVTDSGEWLDTWVAMTHGAPSPPLDYACTERDGLFDQDQLFVVWEKEDFLRMMGRLETAFVQAYPEDRETVRPVRP